MAGLVPAIHVLGAECIKAWMSGMKPGMTNDRFDFFGKENCR
jgi:hypothetical protein